MKRNPPVELEDLVSIGPAMLQDFALLGIKNLKQLAKQDPYRLYLQLCEITDSRQDPCVEDAFTAAIAQARDPHLPEEQKQWYYWSDIRKKRPKRCAWVPVGNTLMEGYHDKEWGVPVHDDRLHFEFLILEGAQAGLSWDTILKRRVEYSKAFSGFDWTRVADYSQNEIELLLKHSGIIRNRLKIEGAVNNARCYGKIIEEFGSFDSYVWSFVKNKPLQPNRKSHREIPTETEHSKALSKDLKKRGFKFVGPTIIYAHMQATGLINDHTHDCFRFHTLGG